MANGIITHRVGFVNCPILCKKLMDGLSYLCVYKFVNELLYDLSVKCLELPVFN